jgi:hypothetical protein
MLQRNRLEAAAVEVLRRPHIIIRTIVGDLQANRGRIIVHLAVIGHCNDDRFQIASRGFDGTLQIGGKVAMPQRRGSEFPMNAIRFTTANLASPVV